MNSTDPNNLSHLPDVERTFSVVNPKGKQYFPGMYMSNIFFHKKV